MLKKMILLTTFIWLSIVTVFAISIENCDEKFFCNSISLNCTTATNSDETYKFSINPTLSKYFNNLTECTGSNIGGSCGYVALGMLLSYYDTFYNDDTIPESYEYQLTPSSMSNLVDESPGIRKEDNYGNLNSISSYTSYFINHADSYFESYLITLCMNSPINYYNQYNIINNSNNLNYICALKRGDPFNILNYYINQRNLYNYYSVIGDYISENETDNSSVINFIKNSIDNGFPVMVGTEPSNGIGHMQVVYDYIYNSNGYTFYANYGWGSGSTHKSIVTSDIVEACTLYTSIRAEGSDNYSLFLNNPDLNYSLTQNELNLISNSKNLWYNYFRFSMDFDFNSSFYYDSNHSFDIYKINTVSLICTSPVFIDIRTIESYDTQFIGNNCTDYNCFMYLYDDIYNVEDDEYCDLNARAAISVTDKISFLFQPSFTINQPYKLYRLEITDYLYNY